MHISDCLYPKRIVNPYTHDTMMVPCGKCAACLNARAARWVQRLDDERWCWQYALFFTLTYNSDNLPVLTRSEYGYYSDTSSKHFDVSGTGKFPFINYFEHFDKYSYDVNIYNTEKSFVDSHKTIPYLSVYDVQKFIKLIRIHIKRKLQSNEKIRYFIAGEYGPRHQRPHFHGLFFFNSERLASALPELIRQDWKFGFVDTSFVSGTNSSYVASYLNCTSHLPKIYENKFLRPFILCSKQPPIGTLAHRSEEVEKIFFEANPEFVIQNHKSGLFANVRLWKYYQDTLFPRLTAFDRFSHSDRVALYRTVSRLEEKFDDGLDYVKFKNYVTSSYALPVEKDYVGYFSQHNDDIDNSLRRWYYIGCRVNYQSASFGISIRDYVKQIEKFVDNVEKLRLKKQFEFEDEYAKEYGSQSLVGLDPLWLSSIMSYDIGDLTYGEICQLESYGIDISLFYHEDLTTRDNYRWSLLPNNTKDYEVFRLDSETIRNKNTKTKIKNEFLDFQKEQFLMINFLKEYGPHYADF